MSDIAAPPLPPLSAGARPPTQTRLLSGGWTRKLPVRMAILGMLALLFSLPLALIDGVAGDRQRTLDHAVADIVGAWGRQQTVIGPTLLVPHESARGRDTALILPERLSIDATIAPEVRHRGLFQAVVYSFDVTLRGTVRAPDPRIEGTPTGMRWSGARLRLVLGDLRGIQIERATIGGVARVFEPSGDTAIEVPLGGIDAQAWADGVSFDVRFRLNGSDRVGFAPAGGLTEVKLAAPWPDPGFIGRFRPVQQRVDQSGFEATWRVSVLNRGFAGVGTSADASRGTIEKGLRDSVFGVQLVQPVAPYRGVDRMIKYGLLTVGCAFALYLAFEMMGGGNVHVVQYGLTGASMTLFPLLLLSAGEHASFGTAYALAAGGVTLQTGLYTWWATRRARFAAGFASAIASLFGYLFVLLRAESWSLLGGSLALFGLLFALMYATRNLGREPRAA